MKLRYITLKQLRDADACPGQLKLFEARYGARVRVTRETCIAAATDFDLNWAVDHLLSPGAQRAYYEATATARRAYGEAIAPAARAYGEAIATAGRAYDEATATAERAYDEAIAPAQRAYDEAQAVAFADAYNGDARRRGRTS